MPHPERPGRYRARIQARANGLVRRRERPGRYYAEPVRLPEPDERQAYRILNFALRAGEVLLAGGAGASDVTATVMAAANACGLDRVDVDVTFTSIVVSYVRSDEVAPVTAMRIVRFRTTDYTRVTAVHNLVEELAFGDVTPEQAFARIDDIRHAAHPYPRWATTLFLAAMAAAVVVFLGGAIVAAGVSATITAVVDRANHWMSVRNVPQFFQNAVGAAVATTTAATLFALDVPLSTSLVVAGGIIMLLPGVVLVGAVHDAITGYLVTASARTMEAVLLTAGIIAGVGVVLYAAVEFGVTIPVADTTVVLSQVPIQVLAAGMAGAFFALATYTPLRLVPSAAAASALGWATFLGLTNLQVPATLATGAAALLVGAGAYVLAGRQQAPPLVLVAAGTIPLLPGLTIYRAMFALAGSAPFFGIVTLVQAVTVGLSLASGAILGEFLAQPVRRNIPRFERRISGPRLAGPLRWREDEDPSPDAS